MSLFEEEKKDTTEVVRFIVQHRKILLIALVAGGIISGVISGFLPKKYRSTAIVYPPSTYMREQLISNPTFGHELEVEYLLQLLESAPIRDSVIQQFELINYYEVDTTQQSWRNELTLKYIKDITFSRSKYLSVVIEATTKNPELSAQIVNYILDVVNKQKKNVYSGNVQREFNFFKERYLKSKERPAEIINRIYALKDTTLSKNFITNFLRNSNSENYIDNDFIDSREMEQLVEDYKIYQALMLDRKADFEQAKDASNKPLLENYVVEKAKPNYKKVSPSLLVNTLAGGLLAFLAVLTSLALRSRFNQIN